jgi:hypothetical protein
MKHLQLSNFKDLFRVLGIANRAAFIGALDDVSRTSKSSAEVARFRSEPANNPFLRLSGGIQ